MKQLRATLIACFFLVLLTPQSAKAIYLGFATSDYGNVGAVTTIIDGRYYYLSGSGTLIADRWVLTAGHVAAISNVSHFYLGNDFEHSFDASLLVPIRSAYVHPDYDGFTSEYDIGLFELENPVPGVGLPTLFDGNFAGTSASGYVGQEATLVGWGATDPRAYTGEGRRLQGNNDIDYFDGTFLYLYSMGNEAALLPGDSGGPSFADFGLGEVLIGVHSFIVTPGVDSYDVAIAGFQEWIDDIVGAGVVRWGNGAFVAEVPEPAPLFLMLAGLLILAFRRKS